MAIQQARGYLTKLIVAEETEFGVTPVEDTDKYYNMPFNTLSVKSEQTMIDPATITGRRDSVEPARGHISVGGSMTVPVDATALGFWLKMIFNEPTSTNIVDENDEPTDYYKHVFKVSNNQPSFSIIKEFPDVQKYFIYNGCKLGSFNMTAGDDGELTADMDILGCDEDIESTEPTKAASAVNLTLDRLNNFSCVLKKDDVVVGDVQTMDIKFDMGLDDSLYLLSKKGRGAIPEGLINISGTLHTIFNSTEYQELGNDATPIKLELGFTSGDYQFNILFEEVQIERTSPEISGPAGITCDIEFRAYYKTGVSNSSVVVTLVNQTEEY